MVRTGGEDLVEPTYFIKWGGGKVVRTGGEDLVEPTYFIKWGGGQSGQNRRGGFSGTHVLH